MAALRPWYTLGARTAAGGTESKRTSILFSFSPVLDTPSLSQDQLSRADIVAQIQRVNAALIAWDLWDTNHTLPSDLKRSLQAPPLDRTELKGLRRVLLRQLTHLSAA